MNNKSTLIGFVLIAAILFGWMYFMSPSKEQIAEQQRIQDSIRRVRLEQMALDSLRQAERQAEMQLAALSTDTTQTELDSLSLAQQQQNALRDKFGIFAMASHTNIKVNAASDKSKSREFGQKPPKNKMMVFIM